MNDDGSAGRARHSALRLLARREHSQYELRRKLKARGYGERLVDELVAELITERLLSDTRYAEAMVTNRASRGYGPLRICMELRDRGVAERIVDKVLQEAKVDWDERLRHTHDRKYGEIAVESFKTWASRAQFLNNRGFSVDAIRRVIGNYGASTPDTRRATKE